MDRQAAQLALRQARLKLAKDRADSFRADNKLQAGRLAAGAPTQQQHRYTLGSLRKPHVPLRKVSDVVSRLEAQGHTVLYWRLTAWNKLTVVTLLD
jgi:hypothetical protein